MKRLVLSVVMAMLVLPGSSWGKVGGGDIVFHVSGAANVVYSHEIHVGKIGLKCRECHYRIYTTVEGHQQKTMADMESGQSCGACHNGTRAFAVKIGCPRCHQSDILTLQAE
jgi:c(7)-type cytochrome triheme protein